MVKIASKVLVYSNKKNSGYSLLCPELKSFLLFRLRELIREWRVSLFSHFCETKKPTPLFKQHMTKAIRQNIRLCFRMKVRFSDAFLAYHMGWIKHKECKNIHVVALDTRWSSNLCVSCLPSGSQGICSQLCNSFLSLSESTWGGTARPGKPKT